jgi:hypothetical protein
VQGYFQDTLTPAFKQTYKADGRSIGYAFLDCNYVEQYKFVFEFIFDMMAEHSYIYMDEYMQSGPVIKLFEQFKVELLARRGIKTAFLRSAGGFGALFHLYPADGPSIRFEPSMT